MDSVLTLYLINNGSAEINPVMDYFLSINIISFVIAKYSMTGMSLVFLINHHSSKILGAQTKYIIDLCALIYFVVICYEVLLILCF